MRKNIKYFVLIIVAAILIFITNKIQSTNLIIWFGVTMIRIAKMIINIVLIAIILIAVVLIFRNMSRLRSDKKKSKQMPVINLDITTDDGYNPDYIRQELNKNLQSVAGLNNEIKTLIEQTDSMDRKQDKLKTILERNDTSSLSSVDNTLANTEQAMFKNIIKIINRIDLWDNNEYMLESKRDIYYEHRERINVLIAKNDEMLNMTDILLSETIKYINTKDDSTESNMHLDSMIETMKSLTSYNN